MNLVMALLLLFVMNYRYAGNEAHEIGGVLLGALFFLHNGWNWRWYAALRKGRWTPRRMLLVGVDGLLLAAMLAALASGAAISQTVFAPLGLEASLFLYDVHSVAAYSAFLLTAIHLGLHWEALLARTQKWLGAARESAARKYACHGVAAVLMLYGVYASFAQHIGDKLLAERSFALWGVEPSLVGFTVDYLAIFGLYVAAAHYLLRCWRALL